MTTAWRSALAYTALLLLSIALVLWVRLVPRSLPITDDWADALARGEVRAQLTSEGGGRTSDAVVDRWIEQHGREYATQKAAIAVRLQSDLRYMGDDGREHVYLGDYDSYLWLRHARNLLRTGTPCDAIADGVCRDTYTNAPVGARTAYARTLHVAAIAGLHRAITLFRPRYPLPESAFLVPVIVGLLGVPPAFFIARALAGTVAGPFAAILTALHPIVLTRTIGSDNDVWNVVLPLYMMWAVIAALSADDARRSMIYAGLAGVAVGLQAWAWRGWVFSYAVVLAALLGTAVLESARHLVQRRTLRIWHSPAVRQSMVLIAVFYVVAGVATTVAGSEESYGSTPLKALQTLLGPLAPGRGAGPQADIQWPSALSRVAEIRPLRLPDIVRDADGTLVFLGGVIGLLLLLSPRERWRSWDVAVLSGGIVLSTYCLVWLEPGRLTAIALLSAPIVVALVARWAAAANTQAAETSAALLLVIWFLAALFTAYDGVRFMLLLASPVGIAAAVVVGRLSAWVVHLVEDEPRWYRAIVRVALGVVLALALLHVVRWGYTAAAGYTPSLRDAWWNALTHIRDSSPPDAIVHTWWDYGHWIKYVAERPVTNDGSSLLTHIPYWVSRALVSPSERESVGVLRMLSCGSDATPLPEGRQGGYGKLRDAGRDPLAAYTILTHLVDLDRTAADDALSQAGFTTAERLAITQSTHCGPPPAYLVLTSRLTYTRRTWMAFGLWDPRRPDRPPRVAGGEAGARIGPDAGDNESDEDSRDLPPVPFVPRWLGCHVARPPEMVCDVHRSAAPGAPTIDALVYDPRSPEGVRLEGPGHGTAGFVFLAGPHDLREIHVSSPSFPQLGVLIDLSNNRMLIGAPALLRSTYVHLMYLDGRYATHYKKFDDRTDHAERIVTWRIDWGAR